MLSDFSSLLFSLLLPSLHLLYSSYKSFIVLIPFWSYCDSISIIFSVIGPANEDLRYRLLINLNKLLKSFIVILLLLKFSISNGGVEIVEESLLFLNSLLISIKFGSSIFSISKIIESQSLLSPPN